MRDVAGMIVTTRSDGTTLWILPNGNTYIVPADKDIILTVDHE